MSYCDASETVPGTRPRRILHLAPSPSGFRALCAALPSCRPATPAEANACPTNAFHVEHGGEVFELVGHHRREDAWRCLQQHYVSLLVLDLRAHGGEGSGPHEALSEARLTFAIDVLDALDHVEDLELRYGFHRILVVVPDALDARIDALLVELGARGVRHVLRAGVEGEAGGPAFAERLLTRARDILHQRRTPRSALCASGGGITGIFFEMGVLKCLDDALVGRRVNDFDMFFGISAGAVVTSLLAVGYTIGELMASIAGHEGGRIPPLNLSLARVSHVNYPDMSWRARSVLGSLGRSARDVLLRRDRPDWDGLFLESTALVGAPFHSRQFERMLREVLTANGGTNDFAALPRPLLIGASDQDERRAMLFGAEGQQDTPISQAVQASLSINPAFGSVSIKGRYYEDGAITRTSNFVEAIQRGANLVLVLDPFVPYVSKTPGVSHRRGLLYNLDQDLRTLSYTRYEATRNHVLRQRPEVSTYTFLPSNSLRRLLSVNPMDHRPYLQIWKGAYLSTLQRLEQVCHRLRGDFFEQGMVLDTARPLAVAARLEATREPKLADFFPDGRVTLEAPPLLRRAD
ncbi:MAG: patatin-like phospholipase family protein [Sandaracinaceae bacterium]|nr:patatin-like phospholipase family protein [Sandaracinaceae bacterium]MBK7155920.1 patatin-like phospholipase family protein [Sandaracinaceae bacterium]MBK7775989.1 patatin-like phospholipase family protein [Sandaracinaceae bacterium]MBK8407938.1 patatin-like phospholipase family protein [Sandaracinaceae bacterium]MBP7685678.1 patatin-like phospholipase family protein [Deltaproteobacteria bacterium]